MKTKLKFVAKKLAIWSFRIVAIGVAMCITYPIGYYIGASIRLHHFMTLPEWQQHLQNRRLRAGGV